MRFVRCGEVKGDSEAGHATCDRGLSDMKSLGNLSGGQSKSNEFFEGISVKLAPRNRVLPPVMLRVFRLGHHFQVLKSIIQTVVVQMMDFFKWFQVAAKMPFHDMTMLLDRFAIYIQHFVSQLNPSSLPIWMHYANAVFRFPFPVTDVVTKMVFTLFQLTWFLTQTSFAPIAIRFFRGVIRPANGIEKAQSRAVAAGRIVSPLEWAMTGLAHGNWQPALT